MITRDSSNESHYRTALVDALSTLDRLSYSLSERLTSVQKRPWFSYHDSLQYWSVRFELTSIGAISDHEAVRPGPARMARVRESVQQHPGICIFLEPQFNADRIASVLQGLDYRFAELDVLGAYLEPGPDLYPQLLDDLASTMVQCLTQSQARL